jgi:ATP-dependent RNA helicase RhlE
MARERPRNANNDPRHTSAPASEPKPVGELKRRPRRRRPSNGGKGDAAKG